MKKVVALLFNWMMKQEYNKNVKFESDILLV